MLAVTLHDWFYLFFGSPTLRVLAEHWIICTGLIAATCLLPCFYKVFLLRNSSRDTPHPLPSSSPASPLPHKSSRKARRPRNRHRRVNDVDPLQNTTFSSQTVEVDMRYTRQSRFSKKTIVPLPFSPVPPPPRAKQHYDAFLVLDIEATCQQGTDFNFPNEIIEFPVCLMRWKDRTNGLEASKLEVVAEFRSFVKPTWRPILSQFCTELTGITQEQVDAAPSFPAMLASLQKFVVKHGLIDGDTGERLVRFCWCSDGPFDIRDFVVKQCFISKVPMPGWMQGDVLDVRTTVQDWLYAIEPPKPSAWDGPRHRFNLNIPAQLKALGLPEFVGRQHSGIDDARNIARIMAQLAWNGISLHPNTAIHPNRRWKWMGKYGQVLDGDWSTASQPWKRL